MEPTTQLSHILPKVNDIVEGIAPAQLNDPTPCARFTVHDVLDHMIVLGGTFAYSFRGEPAPELLPPPMYGVVPAAPFREAMDDLLAAIRSPGALDRTIETPLGPLPGATFARFVAFDALVHGWDLATATSQAFEVDPAVVAVVDEFARDALTDSLRDGDTFAAATAPPPGASRLEQLVAFSGRQAVRAA